MGKTSFLNVIAKRLAPTTGTVRIGRHEPKIEDINYMPQDSVRLLFPHLTLNQNLALQKSPTGVQKLKGEEIVNRLFPDRTILSKYPNHCSGGQKQRAVLCRAVLDVPKFTVTLLDEPFAQISQDVKSDVYTLLQSLVRESGAITLVVTHDISEALIVADQVMVLSTNEPKVFDTSHVNDPESYLEASRLRDEVRRAAFF